MKLKTVFFNRTEIFLFDMGKEVLLRVLNIFSARRFLIFTFVMLQSSLGCTQFYTPNLPPTIQQYPFFNSSFILDANIKSIRTQVIYKASMKLLRFSAESDRYYFSKNGDVEKWVRISVNADSTISTYFLNNSGYLSSEMVKNKNVETIKSFRYNDHGHVVEEELVNVNGFSQSYTEKYSYEYLTTTQYKKYWLNNEGLTYKYSVIDLDEAHTITEERSRFIRGASRETKTYTYKDGLLVMYAVNVKETYRRESKYVLSYDLKGVLTEVNQYIDGAHVQHIEYLYEKEMLTAVLQKNIKTQNIKITKYKYVYWK